MLDKLKRILRLPEFHFFLLFFFLFLFLWPFLIIPDKEHNQTLFIYLFVLWGIIILLLFLITRGLSKGDLDRNQKEKGDA